ncbi:DUF6241 domain-containing protein [Bacillus bingmayongensis]|uniref:DUF6241 domain-containing protein n=1 Tax=Bacillus bingmayongensis TaxID=1150157 RepID=UPI0002ED7D0D|nr:DUF6241 domain-containing protein [Bacillus bingmayongensis]
MKRKGWLGVIICGVFLSGGLLYGLLKLAEIPVGGEREVFTESSDDLETNIAEIEGSNAQLHITKHSTEEEVVSAMHSMAHQKVIPNKNWGATPMSTQNAERVKDILSQSDFAHKQQLLEITEKWIKKDFSEIVEEHNSFQGLMNRNIDTATGTMDPLEETTFVLNTFGDKVAAALAESGDLPEPK